jgi:hypothetical protein
MSRVEDDEPPGWRELCAKLQTASSPSEFQLVLDEINRLLAAHEKSHSDPSATQAAAKRREKLPPKKR